jgi:hypothetical protein
MCMVMTKDIYIDLWCCNGVNRCGVDVSCPLLRTKLFARSVLSENRVHFLPYHLERLSTEMFQSFLFCPSIPQERTTPMVLFKTLSNGHRAHTQAKGQGQSRAGGHSYSQGLRIRTSLFHNFVMMTTPSSSITSV